MHLVAEVLDKQVMDADNRRSGKADGIVASLRPGQPPLLLGIEVGPTALFRRVSERLGRWYARIDARFGSERGKPFRIDWTDLDFEGPNIGARIRADETPIFAAERAARRLLRHVPGA